MENVIDLLRNVASFVVTLGILVFVHELGHYLAARWRGVYVEAFSIGFGPSLAKWTDRSGCVWKLSALPLGGYVKLHGQERPEDVAPEVRAAWRAGQTFHEKSVLSRAIVVAAGPAAHFILAIVLFGGLFTVAGRPVVVPVVSAVAPGGSAEAAGILPGDRIVQIDGKPVLRFAEMQHQVAANPGKTLDFIVRRGDDLRTLPVTIGTKLGDHDVSAGVLGVRGGAVEYESVNVFKAFAAGADQTWDVVVNTAVGIGQIIHGTRSTEELSGPLGIAKLSGDFAKQGLAVLISFIAVLSVNLGLVNLFPIPVLDGGHLVFYAIEALRRGKPLPPRILEYGFRAGFALLACLFVFATWNDLTHMGLFRWMAGLIG